MSNIILDENEFIDSFFRLLNNPAHMDSLLRGFNVTTKIRNAFLLGDHQGRLVMHGTFVTVHFQSLGGGVWRAFIPPEEFGPLKKVIQ